MGVPPRSTVLQVDLRALLIEVGRGSADAFAQLYDEVAPRVHAVTTAVTADDASAERATEAIFIKIWRNAPRYRADSEKPLVWILSIASHHVASRHDPAMP